MARKAAVVKLDNAVSIDKVTRQTNSLRIRIDDLKTFQPLTDNQKLFFDA